MKLRFKQRLFLYFTLIFSVFTVWIYFFERAHDQKIKTEALGEKLDIYAQLIVKKIYPSFSLFPKKSMDSLQEMLPDHLRITLIDLQGKVLYDNSIETYNKLENHLHRPEIEEAKQNGKGNNIRVSASNQEKYFYFARKEGNFFVRVALPYDIETRSALQPDGGFFYFLIVAYFTILILINWVANRFGKSIKQLRDFALHPSDGSIQVDFPKDEFGEIGQKIMENYHQLHESKNQNEIERDKLLQHVQSSKEGICFFTEEKVPEFYNGLFIQYVNLITDVSGDAPSTIFSDGAFVGVQDYLKRKEDTPNEYKVKKQGKTFTFRTVSFENGSFEVIINDVTKQEKTLLLKQEMTSNIAHELRTPITGIRGYLETILSQALPEEKKTYFIRQAYNQTKLLSEIVQDMSLISKIEEVGHSFTMEPLDLSLLLQKIKEDFSVPAAEKDIQLHINIRKNAQIDGNQSLLYSIFKNLVENAIRYGGNGISIVISLYKEDNEYYYFSVYDTGVGIQDENHLPRLFERFYRIGEGRTRETGGSGLGLSIVKNAVLIHGGIISAKNRKEGGLEFLFDLKKGNLS